jgi:hypothetical protein
VAGPEGIIWTRLALASLPDGVTGLWFKDFGAPEGVVPPEIIREACVREPISIHRDGQVVFFESRDADQLQPVMHMRCAADLTCQMFSDAPGQELELQGTAKITVSGKAGSVCAGEECRPIARCPALKWTEEERSSGFVDRWEAAVQAPQQ